MSIQPLKERHSKLLTTVANIFTVLQTNWIGNKYSNKVSSETKTDHLRNTHPHTMTVIKAMETSIMWISLKVHI